jgi:hypothetical protein
MALLPGSPARDAGSNLNIPAHDQRGFARAAGPGIDIGAFEAPPASLQPAGVMTHFGMTTDPNPVAGTPFNITVQALDDSDNPVPDYVGPVHLTIYDGQAVLRQDYTLTGADAGTHAFKVTVTTTGARLTVSGDTPAGPLTEAAYLTVSPGAAVALRLSAPGSTTAGQSINVTATLLDAFGNVATNYTGVVRVTSSDGRVPSRNYSFASADAGTRTIGITLKTAGSQSITATDTANGSLTGSVTGINVAPAAAAALVFGSVPAGTTAGSAVNMTLTAQDAYGNVATGYTGTAHFSSSDGQAVLPADYAFTASDAGTHTFAVTLKTAGTQSLTATDTRTSGLTGTANGIVVNPAAAARFILSAPARGTHGAAFTVTLTVQDAYGNVATGYAGTVRFSSSDGMATLPAAYAFTASDAGTHTFTNQITLRKKGTQTLTVTDPLNRLLTTTVSITVA